MVQWQDGVSDAFGVLHKHASAHLNSALADWERAPPLPDSGGDWERRLGVETIVRDEFDEEPLETMLRRRKGAGFGE